MISAFTLPVAMVLDAWLGEPSWLWSRIPHPAVMMGKMIAALEHSLNKGRGRRAKGVVTLCILLIVACTAGVVIEQLGSVAEMLAAAVLLAQRSLADHVAAVAEALRTFLPKGRAAVSMIVSRDTAHMNESQFARAAVESAAENLSDGVLAPAFWFLIGGVPGLIAYKMVNTADSMIGYRTPRHEAFGWAAARLDDLLNLIPARLTAALIALAACQHDIHSIRRDARLHRSPNAGWPEAAMARALGIALAGPRAYDGRMRHFAWVNAEGRRDLTAADIDESVTILWKTWAMMLAICTLIGIVTS